jgi:dihydrofolate reductase
VTAPANAAGPAGPAPGRPEVEAFLALSIDGFIARPDGAIDWLDQAQAGAPPGEDFGYAAFAAGIDALVMGRRTFDTVAGFDPWPYGPRPVHVLTRQPSLAVPPALRGTVRVRHEPPRALLASLAEDGVRRVYLDGGEVVRAFLLEDLVDAVTLTTVPVLIGWGRPLFGPGLERLPGDRRWQVLAVRHWDHGVVQVRWRCR